jgi:bifunctional DNase/RNase
VGTGENMNKIALEIVALSHAITRNHSYAVVLGEKKGYRRLPIVIGGSEAQAIAVAMEDMAPTRPLTHDLMKSIFETFEVDLKEVIINNLLDGVFYAKLICFKEGEEIEIDSRTSDALALAVRFECPIYTYEFILDSAGIVLEESHRTSETGIIEEGVVHPDQDIKENLSTYSVSDLDKLLLEALEKEDYERAAKLRDELNKR